MRSRFARPTAVNLPAAAGEAAAHRATGTGASAGHAVDPQPPGEVVLRPLFVGICGTDLQIVLGERPDRARVLGHEGVVEVLERGPGWEGIDPHGVYVMNPVHPARQDEVLGHSYDGLLRGIATFSIGQVDPRQFVPVPPGLSLPAASLAEPLATAIYGRRLVEATVRPERIVIFGAGPAGLMQAQIARAAGGADLRVVATSRDRLDWAERRSILRPGEGMLWSADVGRRILRHLHGPADAVFVCTPARSTLGAIRSAIECVRDRGCIDLVGGVPLGARSPEIPDVDLTAVRRANHSGVPEGGTATLATTGDRRRIWITGHRGTSTRHVEEALGLLGNDASPFTAVISHVASLDGAVGALAGYRRDRRRRLAGDEWVKLIVDIGRPGSDIVPFVPGPGWPPLIG